MVACAPVSPATAQDGSTVDNPQVDFFNKIRLPERLATFPVIGSEELVFREILTLCGLGFNSCYWDKISTKASLPKLEPKLKGNQNFPSYPSSEESAFSCSLRLFFSSERFNLGNHINDFLNRELQSINCNNNNTDQSYIKFTLAFYAARQFIKAFNSMPAYNGEVGSRERSYGQNVGFQVLLSHKFVHSLKRAESCLQQASSSHAKSNGGGAGFEAQVLNSSSLVKSMNPRIENEPPKVTIYVRPPASFLERLNSNIQGLFTGIKNFFIGKFQNLATIS